MDLSKIKPALIPLGLTNGRVLYCVSSQNTSFYCTVCKRTMSCSKQGVDDVKVHMETNIHQNNAKGMKNQSTLFQVCTSKGDWDELSGCTDVIFELCNHHIKWCRKTALYV